MFLLAAESASGAKLCSIALTFMLAPLVYLHTQDLYRPTDLSTFLKHVTPKLKLESAGTWSDPLTLENLNKLNSLGERNVNLTSNDDVSTNPTWILGATPDSNGKCEGIQTAIIVNQKSGSITDAFYMYYYAYNWGGLVLGNNLGIYLS